MFATYACFKFTHIKLLHIACQELFNLIHGWNLKCMLPPDNYMCVKECGIHRKKKNKQTITKTKTKTTKNQNQNSLKCSHNDVLQ